MRIASVKRVSKGKNRDASSNLDELVLITEAAFFRAEIVWALQHAVAERQSNRQDEAVSSIKEMREQSKEIPYETQVVRYFCELVAQSAAFHGREVFWESSQGDKRVDVVMAASDASELTLLEFGFFSREKLRDDTLKLSQLRGKTGFRYTTRYLILFRVAKGRASQESGDWVKECESAVGPLNVGARLRAASCQDLFQASQAKVRGATHWRRSVSNHEARCLQVALFDVP